jgi:hypothetical protein
MLSVAHALMHRNLVNPAGGTGKATVPHKVELTSMLALVVPSIHDLWVVVDLLMTVDIAHIAHLAFILFTR